MCGIAGIAGPGAQQEARLVETMMAVIAHRGPDDAGAWQAEEIALGHRRLSILDLSPAGRQPFHDAGGRYVVTYNGEIYNYLELRDELEKLGHVFKSRSDTEVLLASYAEWGEDCLGRLNGMWAFAIWDKKDRSLFA